MVKIRMKHARGIHIGAVYLSQVSQHEWLVKKQETFKVESLLVFGS